MKGVRIVQEPKKQIITREIIEKELALKIKKYRNRHFKGTLPYFSLIFLVLFFWSIIIIANSKLSLVTFGLMVISILGFVFILFSITKDYLGFRRAIQFRTYNIVVDHLAFKENPKMQSITETRLFHFKNNGITDDLGSEFFGSFDGGTFDLAECGEKFYLYHFYCFYFTMKVWHFPSLYLNLFQ